MPSRRASDDLSLNEVRSRQFERLKTVLIVGIGVGGDRTFAPGLRGIQHCLCVQDSPENPCPCTWPLIWVAEDDIVAERPAGRRDREGRELTTFVVRRDARLIVERPRSFRAQTYVRFAALTARLASNPPRTVGTPPRVLKKEDDAGALALLKDAFIAGFELGGFLDDATGGAISDVGAEVIEDVVSAATEPWEGFLNQ